MNIQEQIWESSHKSNMLEIEDYIGHSPERFQMLMHLFFNGELRETQRAANIMSNITQKKPFLIKPYLEKIVINLESSPNFAVIRNSVRILQFINVPQNVKESLINTCFTYLEDYNTPIAIRAFSMTVLYNLIKEIPELLEALKLIIENSMINGSAGIKSRGKMILKSIKLNS